MTDLRTQFVHIGSFLLACNTFVILLCGAHGVCIYDLKMVNYLPRKIVGMRSQEEVGKRVGVPENDKFSRWFKTLTGTTPAKYRKENGVQRWIGRLLLTI